MKCLRKRTECFVYEQSKYEEMHLLGRHRLSSSSLMVTFFTSSVPYLPEFADEELRELDFIAYIHASPTPTSRKRGLASLHVGYTVASVVDGGDASYDGENDESKAAAFELGIRSQLRVYRQAFAGAAAPAAVPWQ